MPGSFFFKVLEYTFEEEIVKARRLGVKTLSELDDLGKMSQVDQVGEKDFEDFGRQGLYR